MRTYVVGFPIDHDLCQLEQSPLTPYFPCATHYLNAINLAEIPDNCEKQFHNLQKLMFWKANHFLIC